MKKQDGVTLIELIIAVSIIAILVVALGFEYQGWMGRYKVENEIRQIYTDFMNARTNAMQRNRVFFVDFPTTTSYRIGEDLDENYPDDPVANSPFSGSDIVLPTYPKILEHTINWNGGALPTIIFDARGLMSVLPDTSLPWYIYETSTVDADYDCLAIAPTRINMGKWEECDATHGGNECCAR